MLPSVRTEHSAKEPTTICSIFCRYEPPPPSRHRRYGVYGDPACVTDLKSIEFDGGLEAQYLP